VIRDLHSEWGDKDGDEVQQNIAVCCVYQRKLPKGSGASAAYKTQVGPCRRIPMYR